VSPVYATAFPTVLCFGATIAALMLGASAPAEGPVAALFPPWWSSADVVTAAGSAGRIVRLGTVHFIVIVAPDGSDTAERLRAAGAVLVLDPINADGCSPVPVTASNRFGGKARGLS
jgi:hypothetical protein